MWTRSQKLATATPGAATFPISQVTYEQNYSGPTETFYMSISKQVASQRLRCNTKNGQDGVPHKEAARRIDTQRSSQSPSFAPRNEVLPSNEVDKFGVTLLHAAAVCCAPLNSAQLSLAPGQRANVWSVCVWSVVSVFDRDCLWRASARAPESTSAPCTLPWTHSMPERHARYRGRAACQIAV
eukprot:350895-Chlamydomonas_euryale.AAC.8